MAVGVAGVAWSCHPLVAAVIVIAGLLVFFRGLRLARRERGVAADGAADEAWSAIELAGRFFGWGGPTLLDLPEWPATPAPLRQLG